jgi:beta-N-acetylhexosaminidase
MAKVDRRYFSKTIVSIFRFNKRDPLKVAVMRCIKIFIFIFLFLPACRTTRDTIVPQVNKTGVKQAQRKSYNEEIVMKFPEQEPRKPADAGEAGRQPDVEPEEPVIEYDIELEEPVIEHDVELEEPVIEPRIDLEEIIVEPEPPEEVDLSVEIDWIKDHYMNALSIEQKIGQRFIAHINGKRFSKQTSRLIEDDYVAGVILYPWNVEDPEQVRSLTSEMQENARRNDPPIELLVCVDQEGGRVNAFTFSDISQFPAPFYWTRHEDPLYVESAAYIIGREINSLGCNMNFAPVLDVYGIPDRTIIGDRSMGNDPDSVGLYGISYIRGAERAGVISVVKHFPGHGYTSVDSHVKLPIVDLEEWELHSWDMKPFKMAIDNGADAVMTSHVLYSKLDPDYPATLSMKILRDILREQYGFDGVIISDGIAMGAISNHFDITETLKLSFKAGIDLILVHSKYDLSDLRKKVYRLYKKGEISEHEINEGVERVLELKLKYGLLPDAS